MDLLTFDRLILFQITTEDKDFVYQVKYKDETTHDFPLHSCNIEQISKDKWSQERFEPNVLTAAAMQELINAWKI